MPIRPADPSIETIITAVKEKHAPDDFAAYFDIQAQLKDGVLHLSGRSDSLEAIAELRAAVMNARYTVDDHIQLVPQRDDLKEKIWAIVTVPDVRAMEDERFDYPLSILPGTPLARLVDFGNGTGLFRLPDGHLVKLAHRNLRLATETDIFIWNRREKVLVTQDRAALLAKADPKSSVLLELPQGSQLRLDGRQNHFFEVALPNGTRGYLAQNDARELLQFQLKNENLRRESPTRFIAAMNQTAEQIVKDNRLSGNEETRGLAFLRTLFLSHDLILPADLALISRAFPSVDHGRHGERLRPGDLLLFRNDKGRETIAFVSGPSRFITTGYPQGRLGTPDAHPLGRLVHTIRPDYGFLNDPCLTSTRSNPFYQTPAVKLVPCRNRSAIEKIR